MMLPTALLVETGNGRRAALAGLFGFILFLAAGFALLAAGGAFAPAAPGPGASASLSDLR